MGKNEEDSWVLGGVRKFPGILGKEKVIYKHQMGASVVKYYLGKKKKKKTSV